MLRYDYYEDAAAEESYDYYGEDAYDDYDHDHDH